MLEKYRRFKALRRLVDTEIVQLYACPMQWKFMEGNDRIRKCQVCQLDVYNFIGLSADEIRETVSAHEGRLCARFYARPDGTVTLESCADSRHAPIPSMGIVAPRPLPKPEQDSHGH